MKLLIALSILIGSSAWAIQPDYAAHMSTSMAGVIVADQICTKWLGMDKKDSLLYSVSGMLLIGATKELFDNPGQWSDMEANAVGVVIGMQLSATF